jgi:predicted Zn-ribbon and HTH transcriptional regulator
MGIMARVMLAGFRCERCGHEWVPRDKSQEPRVCPKCKSPYWDRPRRDADPSRTASETT